MHTTFTVLMSMIKKLMGRQTDATQVNFHERLLSPL